VQIEELSFRLGNVVLLYNDLPNARVSRDKLFSLFEGKDTEHFEVGPLLLVRFKAQKIDVSLLLPENRVEVKIENPGDNEWKSLAETAVQVYSTIQGSSLKAFGYNYFADIVLTGAKSAEAFLVDKFGSSLEGVEQQIGSKIDTLAMTLTYKKDGGQRQLTLGPKPGERVLAVHLNVHYESDHLEQGVFVEDYVTQRSAFASLLPKLLD
jgi:hypothetical protein